MHWTETVRHQHAAAQRALARRVNRSAVSVPIGDSPYTAPGWIYEGIWWTGFPDALYPWDRDVFRFIREFCPDAIPLTMTCVYRWSNYNELGHLGEPVIIRRHAIGRYIRDPIAPVHSDFPLVMPAVGFHARPNYIETIWHADDTRPYGNGIPIGDYLALDWESAYAIKAYAEEKDRETNKARAAQDEQGQTIALGAAKPLVSAYRTRGERRKRFNDDERAYIDRDLANYYSVEPSDLEWKEAALREPEPERRPLTVTVPDLQQPARTADTSQKGADV